MIISDMNMITNAHVDARNVGFIHLYFPRDGGKTSRAIRTHASTIPVATT